MTAEAFNRLHHGTLKLSGHSAPSVIEPCLEAGCASDEARTMIGGYALRPLRPGSLAA